MPWLHPRLSKPDSRGTGSGHLEALKSLVILVQLYLQEAGLLLLYDTALTILSNITQICEYLTNKAVTDQFLVVSATLYTTGWYIAFLIV